MHKFLFAGIRSVSILCRRYCTFDFLSKPAVVASTKTRALKKKITLPVIRQLEKLSLVDFGDEKGFKIVEDAASFASQIDEVNTDGVDPLITVLENEPLSTREDIVQPDINRTDLLSHSMKIVEHYYTAPAGNIAFVPKDEMFEIKKEETDEDTEQKISVK